MIEAPLTAGQADNLRSVNLHLRGVVHGDYFRSSSGQIYVDFAPEAAYRGVNQLIGSLRSDRGDTVTVENSCFIPEQEQKLADKNERMRKGTFMPDQHPDMLAYRRHSTPMDYAQDLALTKNIPVHYADVSEEEMATIREDFPRGPLATALSFVLRCEGRHAVERNRAMLRRLAQIAGNMAIGKGNEKPILAHVVGGLHVPALGRMLKASEVPFTHNLRPIDALIMPIHASRTLGFKEIAKRRYDFPPKQSPYGESY